MRCALGQSWNGSTCVGDADQYIWETASSLKHIFSGHDDWRLPENNELVGIVDQRSVDPAIDSVTFPIAPSGRFWTSEKQLVSFIRGGVYRAYSGTEAYVRLVRGGQASLRSAKLAEVHAASSVPIFIDTTIAEEQFEIGKSYHFGIGRKKDYRKAAEFYFKSAKLGYAKAQNNLGVLYSEGLGFAKDKNAAMAWFRGAAVRGFAIAQNNLASILEDKAITENEIREAVGWYLKAAEQGNSDAQCHLGFLYEEGEGVPQDLRKASDWYRKAAAHGDNDAKSALMRIDYSFREPEPVVSKMIVKEKPKSPKEYGVRTVPSSIASA